MARVSDIADAERKALLYLYRHVICSDVAASAMEVPVSRPTVSLLLTAAMLVAGTAASAASSPATNSPLFFAWVSNGTYMANQGSSLVFPNVILNVQGGYSSSTGAFTAPIAGYYSFSYAINGEYTFGNNLRTVALQVVAKSGATVMAEVDVAVTNSTQLWTNASNTAVTYLNKGDLVSVFRVCCAAEQPLMWSGNFSGNFLHK